MKSPRLPKGHSQLEIKATLRHRDQVNDTLSVTFEPEPELEALERYTGWAAQILDEHANQDRILETNMVGVWKTRARKAERALEQAEKTLEKAQWRLRIDADDLAEGKHVVGLLKTGSLAIVNLQGRHWCLSSTGSKCFDLSMWRTLPALPEGWEPL